VSLTQVNKPSPGCSTDSAERIPGPSTPGFPSGARRIPVTLGAQRPWSGQPGLSRGSFLWGTARHRHPCGFVPRHILIHDVGSTDFPHEAVAGNALGPPPPPGGGPGVPGKACQALAQVAPLRVYAVGAPLLPVWVAWNPKLTDAPGATTAL
jgi:hypothetical protein